MQRLVSSPSLHPAATARGVMHTHVPCTIIMPPRRPKMWKWRTDAAPSVLRTHTQYDASACNHSAGTQRARSQLVHILSTLHACAPPDAIHIWGALCLPPSLRVCVCVQRIYCREMCRADVCVYLTCSHIARPAAKPCKPLLCAREHQNGARNAVSGAAEGCAQPLSGCDLCARFAVMSVLSPEFSGVKSFTNQISAALRDAAMRRLVRRCS